MHGLFISFFLLVLFSYLLRLKLCLYKIDYILIPLLTFILFCFYKDGIFALSNTMIISSSLLFLVFMYALNKKQIKHSSKELGFLSIYFLLILLPSYLFCELKIELLELTILLFIIKVFFLVIFYLGYLNMYKFEGYNTSKITLKSFSHSYINEFLFTLLLIFNYFLLNWIPNSVSYQWLNKDYQKGISTLGFLMLFIPYFFSRYLLFDLPIKCFGKPLGYIIYNFFLKQLNKKVS